MSLIHLIGSEGFIGRALQRVATDNEKLHCWSHKLSAPQNNFDLLDSTTWQQLLAQKPSCVILLSWPGLPNYHNSFHVTRNLPACISLVEKLVDNGLKRLVISGTCYEYGLQNGALLENQLTNPNNCYAIAKDSLRRTISHICNSNSVSWRWLRIFYPYGDGQNQSSLLPSLYKSIKLGNAFFPMSSGRQIRDFVAVDDVARQLLLLACHPSAYGLFNGGSGRPLSIREFVEEKIHEHGSNIQINAGAYPDRNDEPLAFWANMTKFDSLKNSI